MGLGPGSCDWVAGNAFRLRYFKEQSVTVSCSSSTETVFLVRICVFSDFLWIPVAGEGNSEL